MSSIKKLVFILSVFTSVSVYAQRETFINLQGFENTRYNWGYYLGLGSWGFKLDPVSGLGAVGDKLYVDTKNGMAFSVGLMAMMNINQFLDVRLEPGIHFVSRQLIFSHPLLPEESTEKDISSTYLDVPVLLHFRGARWNNIRPFIAGGGGYMRNLQSNEYDSQDNQDGVMRMTTDNWSLQAEVGVELYFKRFKMTPSIKGYFMMNNEVVADNEGTLPYWANAIEDMRTRAFVVSLKFE